MGRIPKTFISKEQLYEDYIVNEMGISTIAKLRGMSTDTVMGYIRKYKIPKRRRGGVAKVIPEEELRSLYLEQHIPVSEIAKRFDVTPPTIYSRLKEYNIKASRPYGEMPLESELRELYEQDMLSMRNIAEIYHVSTTTIGRWLEALGIERRPSGKTK